MKRTAVINSTINLSESRAKEFISYNNEPSSEKLKLLEGEDTFRSVVVFNAKDQLCPLISDWLTRQFKNTALATPTISTYANNLRYFTDYLNEHDLYRDTHADDALFNVERHTIHGYFTYLKRDKGFKTSTIRNRDASIAAFYTEYLCKRSCNPILLRKDNPYQEGLISPSVKRNLVEMASLDDLLGLLKQYKLESERVVVQFMYDSGLRVSEVGRVTKADIDNALAFQSNSVIVDEKTFLVPPLYKPLLVKGSKGRKDEIKPRVTMVSISTLKRVKRYLSSPSYRKFNKTSKAQSPAFLNSKGRVWKTGALKKMISRGSERALKAGIISKSIYPHVLRHSFAYMFLASTDLNGNALDRLFALQQCLGHNSFKTTEMYTAIPYDIFGALIDDADHVLTRNELMDIVCMKTKLKNKLIG